jgi:protein O-GlcNAc transferase
LLHREWDAQFAEDYKSEWREHQNERAPDRLLRVGFVSADFGRHPVGHFVVGLLKHLSSYGFQTYCYSDRIEDELTIRIQEKTDVWIEIRGWSDEQLALKVREDRIDILVDLAGHSAHNRLLVFARKPAPVQVSWAGYVATTGLSAIDYLISDKYSTHKDEEDYYKEQIIRMPDQWLCYAPPSYAPDVGPLPAKRNGYVTFCSFSNPAKLNAEVISLWARILKAVDNAHLILKYRYIDADSNIKRLTEQFEAQGVPASRLVLEGKSPHADLFERYNDVDIALDTFPYSGGVTTYEALWMGVPVITVPGTTFASRHSLSHLMTIGYPEFIAKDQSHYVELATQLAHDQKRLLNIRSQLRQKMAASPTCNTQKFAKDFGALMRDIWKKWCFQQL